MTSTAAGAAATRSLTLSPPRDRLSSSSRQRRNIEQTALIRALTSAYVEADAAEKVVKLVEEHIDMAVGQANAGLETKIATMQVTMETTLKSGLEGMRSSIEGIKWWVIGVGSVLVATGVGAGFLAAMAGVLHR